MSEGLTHDELSILSTAIAIVQKDAERRRGFVLCTDAKLRKLDKMMAVELIDKLSVLSGFKKGEMKNQALEIAREVGR